MESTKNKKFNKMVFGLLIALAILFVTSLASFGGIFASADANESLFAGGDGTKNNPYQISNEEQLNNISSVSDLTDYGNYYYFKLTDNIVLTGTYSNGYILQVFQGELNGNGKTITSSDSFVYFTLYTTYKAEFTHINIKEKGGDGFLGLVCYGVYYGNVSNLASSEWELTFNDVTIDSVDKKLPVQLENNDSPFVAIVYDGYITFKNCYNYASLNYKGYGGIFLGGYTRGAKVVYNYCFNYGKVTGVKVGFFNGNTFDDLSTVKLVTSESKTDRVSGYTSVCAAMCVNLGSISGTTTCSPFATNDSSLRNKPANDSLIGTQFYSMNGLSVNNYLGTLALELNDEGKVAITGSLAEGAPTADHYVISYYVQFSFYDGSTSRGSSYIKVNKTVAYNGTVDYVSAIVTDTAYTGDLSEGAVIYEDYESVKCTLVGDTLVVDSESVMEVYLGFDPTIDNYNLASNTPVYSLTAYSADGAAICCYTVSGGLN